MATHADSEKGSVTRANDDDVRTDTVLSLVVVYMCSRLCRVVKPQDFGLIEIPGAGGVQEALSGV